MIINHMLRERSRCSKS